MRFRFIVFLFLIIIFFPLPLWAKAIARIAVLPFEVNTPGNPDTLRNELLKKISEQILKNRDLLLIDQRTLNNFLLELDVSSYTDENLQKLAEKTGANFILFGSLTQFKQNFSLDYYLFNNFEEISFSKNFVEGRDLPGLTAELVNRVSKEIKEMAENIPSSQAPTEAESESGIREETISEVALPPPPKEETPKESESNLPPTLPEEKPEETVIASLPRQMEKEDLEEKAPTKRRTPSSLAQFQPSDKPVHITADSLEADNTQGMAIFKGNVVARQEDMVMFSDTMSVRYDEKGGMKQIIATGNVKITRGDRVATAQKVVFYNPEQKIVLTGNPRVWQGSDVINGERITILVRENRSIVEGSKDKRVSATIYPKKKEEEKP